MISWARSTATRFLRGVELRALETLLEQPDLELEQVDGAVLEHETLVHEALLVARVARTVALEIVLQQQEDGEILVGLNSDYD